MRPRRAEQRLLLSKLKHLAADMFWLDVADPESIDTDKPLMSGALGLDSLDWVELAMCVEETFGVSLGGYGELHRAGASLGSLADFISDHSSEPFGAPLILQAF